MLHYILQVLKLYNCLYNFTNQFFSMCFYAHLRAREGETRVTSPRRTRVYESLIWWTDVKMFVFSCVLERLTPGSWPSACHLMKLKPRKNQDEEELTGETEMRSYKWKREIFNSLRNWECPRPWLDLHSSPWLKRRRSWWALNSQRRQQNEPREGRAFN